VARLLQIHSLRVYHPFPFETSFDFDRFRPSDKFEFFLVRCDQSAKRLDLFREEQIGVIYNNKTILVKHFLRYQHSPEGGVPFSFRWSLRDTARVGPITNL